MSAQGVIVISGDHNEYLGLATDWLRECESDIEVNGRLIEKKGNLTFRMPINSNVTSAILAKKEFSINILSKEQSAFSTLYSSDYDGEINAQNFCDNNITLDTNKWSVPAIRNCWLAIRCRVSNHTPIAKSTLVVADVKELRFFENSAPVCLDHETLFKSEQK